MKQGERHNLKQDGQKGIVERVGSEQRFEGGEGGGLGEAEERGFQAEEAARAKAYM